MAITVLLVGRVVSTQFESIFVRLSHKMQCVFSRTYMRIRTPFHEVTSDSGVQRETVLE